MYLLKKLTIWSEFYIPFFILGLKIIFFFGFFYANLEDEGDDVVAYVPLAGQLLPEGGRDKYRQDWTDVTLVSGDDKFSIVLHCTW